MQCHLLSPLPALIHSLYLIGSEVDPKYGTLLSLIWNSLPYMEFPPKYRATFHSMQISLLGCRLKPQGQKSQRAVKNSGMERNAKPWATRAADGRQQIGYNNRKAKTFDSSSLTGCKFSPYWHNSIQSISTQMFSQKIREDSRLQHTTVTRAPRGRKSRETSEPDS